MESLRWPVVLIVTWMVAVGLRADAPGDEATKLAGTWVVTSALYNGEALDDMNQGQMIVAGDRMTFKLKNGREVKYTFKVEPAQMPKAMHLAFIDKLPNASPGLAIYDLKGDTLKLVIGPPDRRPTEFTDDGQPLILLQRKK